MFVKTDVHHTLKQWWGIEKSKEHDSGFIKTSVGDEGGFPFISFLDLNVVESPSNVNDGEVFGGSEFGILEDFGKEGKRIAITNGMHIEVTVILNRSKSRVLSRSVCFRHLWCEEEGSGLW